MAENGLQVPFLKRILLKPLLMPGLANVLSALTDTHATIFMLHRFSVPELGVEGHDPAALRQNLAHFRKQGYDLISLEEMFRRLREGLPLKRAVAFTIDDGYFEHGSVGGAVFAEFDCPATIFVVTGFLDGKNWFWWDKLTWIFERTKRTELRARVGGKEILYRLDSEPRAATCWKLNLLCQNASEADRLACVEELSRNAEVELPASPPPRFAPLSWDEARKLEKRGMGFGPHTVTHPVLSTATDAQAEFEITESWARLSQEVARPVPVFCYPNGRLRDFGEREINVIRGLGLWGAVVGKPGPLAPAGFRDSQKAPFLVPRFGYLDSLPHLMQCVSGVEILKARFRGAPA
jgi:peptidoglycan/xylan/chitin deacetylase (PgdA/CDA1 family)